ncbi:hypothetical protein GCM10009104_35930 [Marinobacterium maritimum]|uniref:Uncharacterized protein n=1 Tax=Marinobacterium maritimum TaxID=500162 RepID=A0ABN1IAX7_9GAMM
MGRHGSEQQYQQQAAAKRQQQALEIVQFFEALSAARQQPGLQQCIGRAKQADQATRGQSGEYTQYDQLWQGIGMGQALAKMFQRKRSMWHDGEFRGSWSSAEQLSIIP